MVKKTLAAVFIALLFPALALAGIINKKAPEFSLTSLDGKAVSLNDLRGKVVFLDFWASWCPPCKQEMPELSRLSEKFKASDFAIVAVSVDKKKEHASGFISTISGSGKLIVLHDPSASVVSQYNAQAMPTSFIIDKTGVIKFVHFGYREEDPAAWVREIEGLLK